MKVEVNLLMKYLLSSILHLPHCLRVTIIINLRAHRTFLPTSCLPACLPACATKKGLFKNGCWFFCVWENLSCHIVTRKSRGIALKILSIVHSFFFFVTGCKKLTISFNTMDHNGSVARKLYKGFRWLGEGKWSSWIPVVFLWVICIHSNKRHSKCQTSFRF